MLLSCGNIQSCLGIVPVLLFLQTVSCYKDCRWSASNPFKQDVNWWNSGLERYSKLSRCSLHIVWAKSRVVSNFSSSLENTVIPYGNKATEKVKAQSIWFGHLLWIPLPYQLCYPEKTVTHHDNYPTSHLDCFLRCGTNSDSL